MKQYFWISSGSNLGPPDHQLDTHPTEPPGLYEGTYTFLML